MSTIERKTYFDNFLRARGLLINQLTFARSRVERDRIRRDLKVHDLTHLAKISICQQALNYCE